MKVLHIIPSVAEVRGGTSKAVLDMVSALRAQGLDVTILTTNDSGPSLLDVPLEQCFLYEDVPVYFFERFSPQIGVVREFAFSGHLTRWLWAHITDYDLVHVHAIFSYTSTMAMAVARMKRVPYVVTPHGLLCTWSLQQSVRKKQLYLKLIERTNLNHAQALHFTAYQEAQEAEPLQLTAPNFVLPLGIAIPDLIPNARQQLRQWLRIAQDEPVILFISRLHPKKGLDYLIPALGQLSDQRFTFVIAGDGAPAYEKEIQTLLAKTGISARTCCVGFVRGEQKNLLLQGADLLALTSYSENFGMVVLEALAVGTSVLVTPGVPLATMVEQNKLGYVVELDIVAIAKLLRHILTQNSVVVELGSHARQFITEHYSWLHIAAKLVEVYEAILQKTPLAEVSMTREYVESVSGL